MKNKYLVSLAFCYKRDVSITQGVNPPLNSDYVLDQTRLYVDDQLNSSRLPSDLNCVLKNIGLGNELGQSDMERIPRSVVLQSYWEVVKESFLRPERQFNSSRVDRG